MTGLLAESYNRAYVDFVMNQQLGELEEIQDHKKMLRKAGLGLRATSSNDLLFGSNGNNHSRSASASDLELLSSGGYKSTGNVHMANIPSFSSLAGIGSMSGDGGDTPGKSEIIFLHCIQTIRCTLFRPITAPHITTPYDATH